VQKCVETPPFLAPHFRAFVAFSVLCVVRHFDKWLCTKRIVRDQD
jgi:hypothetical protein